MASPAGRAVRVVLGLLVLVVAALVALYAVGSGRIDRIHALDYDSAPIPDDSASIARGRYIVESHGCTGCHAEDLSGQVLVDAPPFRIVASNLTAGEGGVGRYYTDADWLRALRHGIRPNGDALFVMPSSAYWHLSDEEAGAVVAYLKTIPAIDHPLPETRVKLLGRFIAAMDHSFGPELLAIRPDRRRLPRPDDSTASVALGAYRASVLCALCHAPDMRGGPHPEPGAPPAPDLASVRGWTEDGFVRAMRTGETPGGRLLDNAYMPWEHIGRLSDRELRSLHRFLQTL